MFGIGTPDSLICLLGEIPLAKGLWDSKCTVLAWVLNTTSELGFKRLKVCKTESVTDLWFHWPSVSRAETFCFVLLNWQADKLKHSSLPYTFKASHAHGSKILYVCNFMQPVVIDKLIPLDQRKFALALKVWVTIQQYHGAVFCTSPWGFSL